MFTIFFRSFFMMHQRKSPRAQRYDYRSSGCYFVTICTKQRMHYLGEVMDGEMQLNPLGWWCHEEISRMSTRKTVTMHEWIVMPNHVHILLVMADLTEQMNTGYRRDAFATRPDDMNTVHKEQITTGQKNREKTKRGQAASLSLPDGGMIKTDGYAGPTLGQIIGVLKSNVTKYANIHNIPFSRQGRYHDRIVRDAGAYERIKYYIQQNPKNRKKDCFS